MDKLTGIAPNWTNNCHSPSVFVEPIQPCRKTRLPVQKNQADQPPWQNVQICPSFPNIGNTSFIMKFRKLFAIACSLGRIFHKETRISSSCGQRSEFYLKNMYIYIYLHVLSLPVSWMMLDDNQLRLLKKKLEIPRSKWRGGKNATPFHQVGIHPHLQRW